MEATELADPIWTAIQSMIERALPAKEITFGKVIKRDKDKKLIWLNEFGDIAIPLVSFDYHFEYYNRDAGGVLQKMYDKTEGENPQYHVKIVTPRVGDLAVVLKPNGEARFPMCVGIIQSVGKWVGE